MRLALGKKEFKCLVVPENGTDNFAEDLNLNLYDLGSLMKAWFGVFLLESAAVPLLLYMYHLSFVQVLEECSRQWGCL